MKKICVKKISAFLIAVFLAAGVFACNVVFADLPQESAIPAETSEPGPVQPKISTEYELKCEPGTYEELDLTPGWVASETQNNLFEHEFYIESKSDLNDIILLKIADFETAYKVTLNGLELPPNKTEIDITKDVVLGQLNKIEIFAEKMSGTIKLVYTPLVTLRGVSVVPDVSSGTITANVNVRNRGSVQDGGVLEIAVYELGKFVGGKRTMHTGVGSSETKFMVGPDITDTISSEPIKLSDFDASRAWNPGNPFIYEIVVKLGKNTINSYFCMRNIEESNENIYLLLNGTPIFIKALEWPGPYDLNDVDAQAFYENLKGLNFNTVLYENVFPENLKTIADRMGILVFEKNEIKNIYFADDETTESEIELARASRSFAGIAVKKYDETYKNAFSEIGIAVFFEEKNAKRGEKFRLEVTIVNDKNIDLSEAVAEFELTSGKEIVSNEKKEYESLKKLGTQGRDVMTREFSFEIPKTVKDGEEVVLTVKVMCDGLESVWKKSLKVAGGATYEEPYSGVAVIITLVTVVVMISMAGLVAAYRSRKEKKAGQWPKKKMSNRTNFF